MISPLTIIWLTIWSVMRIILDYQSHSRWWSQVSRVRAMMARLRSGRLITRTNSSFNLEPQWKITTKISSTSSMTTIIMVIASTQVKTRSSMTEAAWTVLPMRTFHWRLWTLASSWACKALNLVDSRSRDRAIQSLKTPKSNRRSKSSRRFETN